MEYPIAAAKAMLRKTRMRVGEDAVKEFAQLLEEITADIASEAAAIANSHGRKTVTRKDIELAMKKIL